MKKAVLFLTITLLSACQTSEPVKDKCPLTKLDTRKQEELCHHFAGEEAYSAERKAFIERKMKELNCEFFF